MSPASMSTCIHVPNPRTGTHIQMIYTFNPSTQEPEVGRSKVQGQPVLHNGNLVGEKEGTEERSGGEKEDSDRQRDRQTGRQAHGETWFELKPLGAEAHMPHNMTLPSEFYSLH